MSQEDKLLVAHGVCMPLMNKLRSDLERCILGISEEKENFTRLNAVAAEGICSPHRNVRSRLYFTSESHIHSLMNIIRLGGLFTGVKQLPGGL